MERGSDDLDTGDLVIEKMSILDLGNGAVMYSRCMSPIGEATAALVRTDSRSVSWGHLEDMIFFAHGGDAKRMHRQAAALANVRPASVA